MMGDYRLSIQVLIISGQKGKITDSDLFSGSKKNGGFLFFFIFFFFLTKKGQPQKTLTIEILQINASKINFFSYNHKKIRFFCFSSKYFFHSNFSFHFPPFFFKESTTRFV